MSREQAARSSSLSLERGTLRLTRLIDNLLESVRIESGQLGIRRQPVALAEVVEDAAELRRRRCSRSAARRSRSSCPTDLPVVEGDAPRLTQVFVNLLANASKFAPEDSGDPHRRASRTATRSRVWVEDEGPGAAGAANGGSIFERFYRAGRPGTGAARARPRALDRQVDRRAARRQRRARRAAARTARASRSTLPAGEGRAMKILVVDDDRDLLALVGFALPQAGYLVVEAPATVAAAMRRVRCASRRIS